MNSEIAVGEPSVLVLRAVCLRCGLVADNFWSTPDECVPLPAVFPFSMVRAASSLGHGDGSSERVCDGQLQIELAPVAAQRNA
mgnify:CR=1 FL=1